MQLRCGVLVLKTYRKKVVLINQSINYLYMYSMAPFGTIYSLPFGKLTHSILSHPCSNAAFYNKNITHTEHTRASHNAYTRKQTHTHYICQTEARKCDVNLCVWRAKTTHVRHISVLCVECVCYLGLDYERKPITFGPFDSDITVLNASLYYTYTARNSTRKNCCWCCKDIDKTPQMPQ